MALMKVGSTYLHCSLTVLESDTVPFLFGLDMLKCHRAVIDLSNNALIIGDEKMEFLSERDIPKSGIFSPPSGAQVTPPPQVTPSPIPQQNEEEKQNSSNSSPEHIKILVDLGFPPHECIKALDICQGNVELAASYLFQRS